MKTAISEKQWTAIIAVGWVLVFVHASMANSIPSGHFGGGGKVLMTVDKVYQNGLKNYANLGRFM